MMEGMAAHTRPNEPVGDFVLTLACPDRPGIVHAVTSFLMRHGGNIMESQQFGDQLQNRFFMRIDFEVSDHVGADDLRADFAATAAEFSMDYELWSASAPYRTLIMVSRQLHCLNDLLFRTSTGDLQLEVPVVVSNHLDAEPLVKSYGLDFHHLPVSPNTKGQAEADLLRLVDDLGIHLIVLARYMQILSDEVCRRLDGRVINIHHSFLPSFKGARPYHQAFDRGVKLVGATAHYVTPDLDEGPIIEQDVVRVDHTYSAEQLVTAGQDVEAQVLSDDLCRNLSGRAINIHHSFLPSFKGAKPYHQAFDRGVKLVGATAHYVTPDLDEGPIIEQDVERVDHAHSPEDFTAVGRDVESVVLARAVRWHVEHRVLRNGRKTVVFN